MSAVAVILAVMGALLVGYWLGRLRPYRSLGDWALRELRYGARWYASKPRQAVLAVVWALTCPADLWSAFKHRHDKPEPIGPAVRILNPEHGKES